MEWISVKERLPEDEGYYLTHDINWADCGYAVLEFYPGTREYNWYDSIDGMHVMPPDYWMPLPDPPEDV